MLNWMVSIACLSGVADDAKARVEAFFADGSVELSADSTGEESVSITTVVGQVERNGDEIRVSCVDDEGGSRIVFHAKKESVQDIRDADGTNGDKEVDLILQKGGDSSVSIELSLDYGKIVEDSGSDASLAEDDSNAKKEEIKRRFNRGHVYFSGLYPVPQAAEAEVLRHLPDLVRWVFEKRKIRIGRSHTVLGHKTVRHWRVVRDPFGRRHNIPMPNLYLGYLGWKP